MGTKTRRITLVLIATIVVVLLTISSLAGSIGIGGGGLVSVRLSSIRVSAQETSSNSNQVAEESWGYLYTLQNGDIVQVGDNTTADFRAHIKTIRNDGTCWFSFNQPGTYVPSLDGLTVSFEFSTNVIVNIYPVEPCGRLPEGGIEYDIQLLKRPAQNVITLDIDWQGITWQKIYGLDAEYNEAICEEEFGLEEAPYTINATAIVGSGGTVFKTREMYEVNSYLGRAIDNRRDTSVLGYNNVTEQSITYSRMSRTYLHIHRGIMTDALNQTAWVEDISIDEADGTITFTLPKDWLRDATYPVSQVCGLDPSYTQDMDNWVSNTYGDSDATWCDYDLFTNKGVPKGAVAEIILSNLSANTEEYLGVRTDGSSLDRRIQLHEAEGGGKTHCRMFVLCDASTGKIETYCQDVSDDQVFYIVGYWENVGFTELYTEFSANSSGSFVNEELVGAGSIDKVVQIIVMNTYEVAHTAGVREKNSSIDRKIHFHEAEGGGVSALDFLVQVDGSNYIEVYTDDPWIEFYNLGYFSADIEFVEKWQLIEQDGDSDWDAEDLTAYLDQDGRMTDWMLTNGGGIAAHYSTATIGVRAGDDSSTARYLEEHESEGTTSPPSPEEFTGFSMSAQSNASGVVNTYADLAVDFHLTGYFKPASAFDISNTPASENLGTLETSSTYYAYGSAPSNPVQDSECTFTVTNSGSACDLDMHIDDFTGGVGWNIAAASPGANEVKVTAYYSGQDPASGLVLANTDAEFYDGLAVSGTIKWDFRVDTGTSFTDGAAKTSYLTITAVAED